MRTSLLGKILVLAACQVLLMAGDELPKMPPADARYEVRQIEGWQIHIDRRLLGADRDATEKALGLLREQLQGIVRRVPKTATGHLREVPLWVSPEYQGIQPRAEYHPGAEWLAENKRNPDMAKGVEFTNVRIFESEVKRMPVFVLHELAHAYHDRVLGFDQPEIKAAYDHAVAGKKYDAVKRFFADGSSKVERAYAMTNEREYFAEGTEAFFGRNDFFPFTREELAKHDPELYGILGRVWGDSGAGEIRQR